MKLTTHDEFTSRHIGLNQNDIHAMLTELKLNSSEELIEKSIPKNILKTQPLDIPQSLSENDALTEIKNIFKQNKVFKNYIGMGYYNTHVPTVILRNILENPSWYTQYTPYQAEISQGRLEALLNFQTMITDLTGMELANASLLDEATAAAEAMSFSWSLSKNKNATEFLVSADCHPQIIEVVQTRAKPMGIKVTVDSHSNFEFNENVFGCLVSYPNTQGDILDYSDLCKNAHDKNVLVTFCTDLLALCSLKPPGKMGADVVIGNSQRFGVPMGYGGPHAAFFATKEAHKRRVPGRIVGVSKDSQGDPAVRLALQTREQHIRRDKATSNICTAQVLLAIMSGMYAVYHGFDGLVTIANRVNGFTKYLVAGLKDLGHKVKSTDYFDTIKVELTKSRNLKENLLNAEINVRFFDKNTIGVSIDETTSKQDVMDLLTALNEGNKYDKELESLKIIDSIPDHLKRNTKFLEHKVFNSYQSETDMLRYMKRLQDKDLSLTESMIPLGSCTMKLNSTSEMLPVTWQEVGQMHPFAPLDQARGYKKIINDLEKWLSEITGFHGVSLQPNAGSQGEYAGLLIIKKYHEANNEKLRNICLIPKSAHGTNPASAVMAGMKVIGIECLENGNIDLADLKAKATENANELAALMITYPSTHGVFEETITEICEVIHSHGGQVYLDGANMNAMVGMCKPGDFGADVCHLNLHKTFSIPHGGGGPGMGPICVASHLTPYLPGHDVVGLSTEQSMGAISAAPWGSPSILTISWMYIRMLGPHGMKKSTAMAILNANYIAKKLNKYFPVLYKGANGFVAHECIIDLRPIKAELGITVDDIAKRLMDYGFHAPTMSWPVINTMMIEPTESESKAEIDRFCEAFISIYNEVNAVRKGELDATDNPLKNAPHTAKMVTNDNWNHKYTRQQAAYPLPHLKSHKFWPAVGRIDNAFGDKNLMCSCDDFFTDS